MNFTSMSDAAVARELGRRIQQMRLERNMTQQAVADQVGLSRISYGKIEQGEVKLINLIAVLRVLGQLEALQQAVPDAVFSPMEQLKLQGKQRQRASGAGPKKHPANPGPGDSHAGPKDEELDW